MRTGLKSILSVTSKVPFIIIDGTSHTRFVPNSAFLFGYLSKDGSESALYFGNNNANVRLDNFQTSPIAVNQTTGAVSISSPTSGKQYQLFRISLFG